MELHVHSPMWRHGLYSGKCSVIPFETRPQTPWYVLDHRSQITAFTGQQAPCLQSHPETHMDIWYTIMENCIQVYIDMLERFQSKVLRIITDAPWYVPNAVIKHDLRVPTVRQEVRTCSVTYHARLEGHPNDLATSLLQQPPHNRRLKLYYPPT